MLGQWATGVPRTNLLGQVTIGHSLADPYLSTQRTAMQALSAWPFRTPGDKLGH